MRPVQGGTQKLTMNSAEKDYQQLLRQSVAQGDGNPYVAGLQAATEIGAGAPIAGTRSKYGNVNLMPQEVIGGETTNFQQKDAPSNAPLADAINQTGALDLEMSQSNRPNTDQSQIATDKLDERLRMYKEAGSNAGFGNNNRQETMRLG